MPRLRYGLSGLFAAVTVVAVLLGLAQWNPDWRLALSLAAAASAVGYAVIACRQLD